MSDPIVDIIYKALYNETSPRPMLAESTAKQIRQQIPNICQPQCEWKMSNDGFYDVWESTCGNSFVLNEGSPEDNEMNYCSHCGGKLIQPLPEDTA